MAKILLLADKGEVFTHKLLTALRQTKATHEYHLIDAGRIHELCSGARQPSCCVYLPSRIGHDGMLPNLIEARQALKQVAQSTIPKVVLISSALVYGTGCARQSLATEEYAVPSDQGRTISNDWSSLEAIAAEFLNGDAQLTVLRPVTILSSSDFLGNLLQRQFVSTLPGHDPTLQFLSVSDLAKALICAAEQNKGGAFNVAPDKVVPLHAAVRLAKRRRLPIPRTLQRLVRSNDTLDYLRYPWTVLNSKIKKELGFTPLKSSVAAILEKQPVEDGVPLEEPDFDEFGMDAGYLRFYGRTLFKFLCDYYWRIEVKGLEHVPSQGAGILIGPHRGFMPFDGVMTIHVIARNTGRPPRFLAHSGLLKFPFLSNFLTKLGCIIATQESAGRVLQSGQLLGLFPEGIMGAFSRYRDAYKLQAFGRDAFVKLALQHRVPILPFLTVGSAEIFPILGKIKSQRWTRYSEWPCLPITPTFPLLPVPLPSKWHMQFLPPIHVEEQYPPEAANDSSVVKAISLDVRAKMQQVWDEMLARRRAIFWGSIF